ncbi:hypothetical protein LRAMOSA01676 [Lichtheimia ramosa]|uniref:TIGR02453 family protein n=1 Tax=Lichtheimia ramosa TaxID=688394 RepID=A0A077WM46_9FUNG|nr:hypothetical protein LRAMOSA01676 [Lichtheimia ramosa]
MAGKTAKKRAFNKPNTNQVDSVKETSPVNKRPKRAAAKRKETNNDAETASDSDNDTQQVNQKDGGQAVTSADDMKPGLIAIPRPKGSPFPDALSPDVLQFMSELKENNHRDFMRLNEKRWHSVRKDFIDFIGMVIEQLHEMDPTVLVEEPRQAIYRQNRDLRFTNDLRPYKTHLSASFSRGGKKSPFAGYHISISPGDKSFVAAGIWQPSPDRLARLREGIIENANLMREALTIPAMKQVFGKDGLDLLETDDKLKVAPKNIPRDHPEIEMLRYKSMVITKQFTDEEIVSAGCLDRLLDVFEALVPFVAVLNSWTG